MFKEFWYIHDETSPLNFLRDWCYFIWNYGKDSCFILVPKKSVAGVRVEAIVDSFTISKMTVVYFYRHCYTWTSLTSKINLTLDFIRRNITFGNIFFKSASFEMSNTANSIWTHLTTLSVQVRVLFIDFSIERDSINRGNIKQTLLVNVLPKETVKAIMVFNSNTKGKVQMLCNQGEIFYINPFSLIISYHSVWLGFELFGLRVQAYSQLLQFTLTCKGYDNHHHHSKTENGVGVWVPERDGPENLKILKKNQLKVDIGSWRQIVEFLPYSWQLKM